MFQVRAVSRNHGFRPYGWVGLFCFNLPIFFVLNPPQKVPGQFFDLRPKLHAKIGPPNVALVFGGAALYTKT
jgi:hypothetical protein